MTTQDRGLEERGPQPRPPADDAAATDIPNVQSGKVRSAAGSGRPGKEPLEVPVIYAELDPLAWESDERVLRGLRCVTVMANVAVAETVSITLSYGDSDEYLGMVSFDLVPTDALALADELRLAAEEAGVACECGRD